MKITDLSHPIHEGMTTFPVSWHPMVEITQMGRHGVEARETRKVLLGTHTGTHLDAPSHFIEGGSTIDQIPLDLLVGEALLIDLSYAKPNQEIQVAELEKLIGAERPKRLVLRFDWSDHWGKTDFYSGQPFLSEACGPWLVNLGIKLLGLDTPQADSPFHGRGCDKDSPLHKIFLSQGIIQLEYLTNLKKISSRKFELVALPLNILQGDGSPCRCIAIER
ncbi:MAG: cyclase family protein [Rhodospirillaceae bacterium]|nr:cyclase family protein [Rhodospirillaceae bacterium]